MSMMIAMCKYGVNLWKCTCGIGVLHLWKKRSFGLICILFMPIVSCIFTNRRHRYTLTTKKKDFPFCVIFLTTISTCWAKPTDCLSFGLQAINHFAEQNEKIMFWRCLYLLSLMDNLNLYTTAKPFQEHTQTEVQYRCSGVQYILHVHCQQYSVAAVYTVHAVYLTLPHEG